jgi:ABC-type branched-subunit amino acid transport system permease subunit
MRDLLRLPGARLVMHLAFAVAVWLVMTWIVNGVDPLMNYYIALVAMYATAMFGMVILVGMSGQVSLGNGALMAIGAYSFALTSMNWRTVPLIGVPMNGWWAMVFAGIGGVVFGLIVGGLAARLKGPYLAGLTLGIAVGIPAIANRFPDLFGGENGLMLTVPFPDGGYSTVDEGATTQFADTLPTSQDVGASALATAPPSDMLTASNFPSAGASSDMLTASNFPSAGASSDMMTASNFPSAGASSDMLTASNFPSAGASSDMLTASNFPSAGASSDMLTASNFPSADASAGVPDVSGISPDGSSGGVDASFILEKWQASLAVLVACIVLFMALNLVRGRQGRLWRAVRDDPVAAAVSGISPSGAKVSAFVISSLFAALAGGVFAQILSYVGPGAYSLGLSLSLLVGVVLGGRSSLLGAVIGAVLLVWLPQFVLSVSNDRGWSEQVTNNMPNLLYGLLVVLVVLVAPGGIVGSLQALVAKVTKR